MGLNVLWAFLSLAGVLGLFFILVYAIKKLNSGLGYVNGSRMKVIDRIALGKDMVIAVVNVAGRLMLVGATAQHIEKLADLDMTPEEYNEFAASPGSQGGMSFASAFAEVISGKKGAGKKENGDD